MEDVFRTILKLIRNNKVRISEHGYQRAYDEDIFIKDIIASVDKSQIVEEYPDYPKGPCVLLLQKDSEGIPIHVLWGIPKGKNSPAVLVTAYRPDPYKWQNNFSTRRKQ